MPVEYNQKTHRHPYGTLDTIRQALLVLVTNHKTPNFIYSFKDPGGLLARLLEIFQIIIISQNMVIGTHNL